MSDVPARMGDPTDFRKALERLKPRIQQVLPPGVSFERVLGMAALTYGADPKLQQCTRQSILRAIIEAASMGLPLDKVSGLAYLVPFMNRRLNVMEGVLIIGYQGKQELAYRSGKITSITAEVVRKKDRFTARKGTDEVLSWEPCLDDDPGPVIAAFAIARLTAGGCVWVVVPKRDLDVVMERSRAAGRGDSPWQTDYEAMARKTAIHRLYKSLPKTPEMSIADAVCTREERGMLDMPVLPDAVNLVNEGDESVTERLKHRLAGPGSKPETTSDSAPRSRPDFEPEPEPEADSKPKPEPEPEPEPANTGQTGLFEGEPDSTDDGGPPLSDLVAAVLAFKGRCLRAKISFDRIVYERLGGPVSACQDRQKLAALAEELRQKIEEARAAARNG